MTIKLLVAVTTLGFALVADAQTPPKASPTPQQRLMGVCNKEVAGLKGDERKSKMSACLADGKKRQQELMKACAAQNKGKKGDEYKAAQRDCLSKS